MSAIWRVQMKAEFEYAVQKLKDEGVISHYYITVANDNPAKQISDVKDMITKGVDGIIIAASNPSALSPVVEEAMDAGIKVVSWNMLVDTDNVTSKIYQSHKEFGRVGAEFLNYDSIAPIYPLTMVLTALDTMIASLNGEEVEKVIEIPMNVITVDTIDDYYRLDLSDAFWCDDMKLPDEILKNLFE